MSFFKITNTNIAEAEAKVVDTDFKEFYPAVNRNMEWSTLKPFIEQAEEIYIKPFIGAAFYKELEKAYQDDSLNSVEQEVWQDVPGFNWIDPDGNEWVLGDSTAMFETLKLIRTATAYYSMFLGLGQITMRVGDAGTQESNTDYATPIRQWVFQKNEIDCYFYGYAFLDKALSFINEKIDLNDTDFDTFKSSDVYGKYKEVFIQNAAEFGEYFHTNGGAIIYESLKPYIKKAQQLYLYPLLGTAFTNELLTDLKEGNLTAEGATLVDKIKRLLAEYILIESIPETNFVNNGNGWKVWNYNDGIVQRQNPLFDKELLGTMVVKAKENAVIFKSQLEYYLYDNLDSFATFKDSSYNKDKNYDPDAYHSEDDPFAVNGAVLM